MYVCSSCFFDIKAVSTRLLTSKGIMYIKASNMVRLFSVKLTAVQSTIENQSAAGGPVSGTRGTPPRRQTIPPSEADDPPSEADDPPLRGRRSPPRRQTIPPSKSAPTPGGPPGGGRRWSEPVSPFLLNQIVGGIDSSVLLAVKYVLRYAIVFFVNLSVTSGMRNWIG